MIVSYKKYPEFVTFFLFIFCVIDWESMESLNIWKRLYKIWSWTRQRIFELGNLAGLKLGNFPNFVCKKVRHETTNKIIDIGLLLSQSVTLVQIAFLRKFAWKNSSFV